MKKLILIAASALLAGACGYKSVNGNAEPKDTTATDGVVLDSAASDSSRIDTLD